jgi:hypothetical protein
MAEEKVQIAYYGTRDLRRRLKREALERGVSVQDILDKAVSSYWDAAESTQGNRQNYSLSTGSIGTVGERQQFAQGSEGLHMMLDFVYESGPARLVKAMETALDAFASATHSYLEHGTTSTEATSADEESDTLLQQARGVAERAERSLRDEDATGSEGAETGSSNPDGEDAAVAPYPWRKRA